METGLTKQEGIGDIWVQVQCRKLPSIILGCLYRHPKAHSNSFDYIENTLRAIIMRKKTRFQLDDINGNVLLPNNELSCIISTVVYRVSLLIRTAEVSQNLKPRNLGH